jgi:hypothetical protein
MCRQQFSFSRLHFETFRFLSMIHAQQMQDAVHHEQRNFVVERTGMGWCIPFGNQSTNHNVAE